MRGDAAGCALLCVWVCGCVGVWVCGCVLPVPSRVGAGGPSTKAPTTIGVERGARRAARGHARGPDRDAPRCGVGRESRAAAGGAVG
eukprot:scaffold97793_cov67-Phaeocystis_antarctica.AAC.4